MKREINFDLLSLETEYIEGSHTMTQLTQPHGEGYSWFKEITTNIVGGIISGIVVYLFIKKYFGKKKGRKSKSKKSAFKEKNHPTGESLKHRRRRSFFVMLKFLNK